ncbi:winged helix-turn-helix transcriptional regulator [Streptomyces piniterrae]|uniref:Winged helix-turn-helix transcriptional regulator n=1 Tax=Streptomyces piniterrae TaxID=2571125 RepID=A0A4U0NVZ1_9ACTN|nr:helix-turn-helix domain-containing protein [Streptomyces piniterrae]TJZ58760.1 winged helix-turn-helix transcriptional regulator [Streptomyces piniterrae]
MPTDTTPTGAPSGARSLEHPAREDIRLADVLHALADPMRLRIVCALAAAEGELNCADIELPVSKSTCTHHFRVLREHGVIQQIYRGTAKMNGLRRADLDALFPGLVDDVLRAADLQSRRLADEGDA